jgi:hypothetical protein
MAGCRYVSSLTRLKMAEITEYNEDTQCTICNATVLDDRYKCVSCTKFDLCKSCTSSLTCRAMLILSGHNKVEDIHPSHAFLSLPDVMLPPIGSSLDAHLSNGRPNLPRRKLVSYMTRKDTMLMYSCSYAPPWCFLSQASSNHLFLRLYADISAA